MSPRAKPQTARLPVEREVGKVERARRSVDDQRVVDDHAVGGDDALRRSVLALDVTPGTCQMARHLTR